MEPLIKLVIAKMAYLIELWLILERELVECPTQNICCMDLEILHRILQIVI